MSTFLSFPPAYTLQPHADTRQQQLRQWREHVLAWARAERKFELAAPMARSCPLFENAALPRALSEAGVEAVAASLVAAGEAEFVDAAAAAAGVRLLWRRPEEVADAVVAYADATGQRGTVMTTYELLEGGEGAADEAFRGVPLWLLTRGLEVLVARGCAAVLRGAGGAAEGVKIV